MYIVGSQVSDDQIPTVTEEVKKFIQASGGLLEKHEDLGKKKLAYPIKKTRNGFYVLDQFSATAEKISEISERVRTQPAVIRHLIINLDEALVRMEKDRVLQAKFKITRPQEEIKEKGARTEPVRRSPARAPGSGKKIEIDLDAEIEKALESEDLK